MGAVENNHLEGLTNQRRKVFSVIVINRIYSLISFAGTSELFVPRSCIFSIGHNHDTQVFTFNILTFHSSRMHWG